MSGTNTTKSTADFGSWPSPITGQLLTGGNCKSITELRCSPEGHPFWVEQTFPQGKKVLFGKCADTGRAVRWSPEEVSVNNCVHEYGGASVCAGTGDGTVLISHAGGIWQLAGPGQPPVAIFRNAPGQDVRHADIVAHGKFVYCVQESHEKGEEPRNRLVSIERRAGGQCQIVSENADFYAEPRVSPDGCWLAWIQWNNPNMSWERTEVHVAELGQDGAVAGPGRVVLDNGTSNFGLAWTPGPALWALSDIGGRWNVHRVDHSPEAKGILGPGLVPEELGEIGDPLWQFDMDRPFVLLNGSQLGSAIAAVNHSLWLLSASVAPSRIDSVHHLGFSAFHQLCLAPDGSRLFCLASGPCRAMSLIQLDLSSSYFPATVLRETRDHAELSALPISTAQSLTFSSGDGIPVQGYFYPPFSHSHSPPPGQLPPALLFVHGGPTARTTNALDMKIQYFTSRGFAVFDINYRGSSGFGRAFRDHLNGQWGVVDRDDLVNGAKFLISSGRVDPTKVCIMGSSAGGFTALTVLMHPDDLFAAAVSIYGVSDLEELYKGSHKFEKENVTRLIAPYPEGIATYRARSPLHNIHLVNRPVAFLHGTDDPVVPVGQSKMCHEMVKKKGIPTMLKLFPGEAHGFKKAETVAQSVDIAYIFLCKAIGIQPSVEMEVDIDNLK